MTQRCVLLLVLLITDGNKGARVSHQSMKLIRFLVAEHYSQERDSGHLLSSVPTVCSFVVGINLVWKNKTWVYWQTVATRKNTGVHKRRKKKKREAALYVQMCIVGVLSSPGFQKVIISAISLIDMLATRSAGHSLDFDATSRQHQWI